MGCGGVEVAFEAMEEGVEVKIKVSPAILVKGGKRPAKLTRTH